MIVSANRLAMCTCTCIFTAVYDIPRCSYTDSTSPNIKYVARHSYRSEKTAF